jgi:hypothetical protein
MANKPISLTFNYFGKTITVKEDSPVLHIRSMFEMFKAIVITTYGEKEWENMIINMSDELLVGTSVVAIIRNK